MKAFRCSILLAVLTSSTFALGQEPKIEAIPPGEDRILSLKEGDKAPFTGQLFEPATAVRWANWLQQYKFHLRSDLELQKKTDGLEIKLWQEKYKLQQAQYVEVTTDLQRRLHQAESELRSPPWYTTTWFGVVLGVAGTGLAVGLSAYAVNNTR